MKEIPQNVSETVKRLNPHLYPFCAVESQVAQSASAKALDSDLSGRAPVKSSMAIRVSLIVLKRRKLDSDNISGSVKWLRDAIAKSIGCDDGDERITFEYGQALTSGEEGVLVKIELVQ